MAYIKWKGREDGLVGHEGSQSSSYKRDISRWSKVI